MINIRLQNTYNGANVSSTVSVIIDTTFDKDLILPFDIANLLHLQLPISIVDENLRNGGAFKVHRMNPWLTTDLRATITMKTAFLITREFTFSTRRISIFPQHGINHALVGIGSLQKFDLKLEWKDLYPHICKY